MISCTARRLLDLARLVAPLAVLVGFATPAAAGPAEDYLDAQLRVAHALEQKVDPLIDVADQGATRLLAGGKLYLAGEPGMVAELLGRAGGLCCAKRLALDKPLPAFGPNDVVLFSHYGATTRVDDAAWPKLVQSGALVIAFVSAEHPLLLIPTQPMIAGPRQSRHDVAGLAGSRAAEPSLAMQASLKNPLPGNVLAVPVDVPYDSRMVVLPSSERLIPAAPPAIAAAQWAYVAELVGCCRRHGRQLAVYLSVYLDPGRRRYERTKNLVFEPIRPEPIARGVYARQFLSSVIESLEAVRRDEVPKLRQAGLWLREASAAKRQVVRNMRGHLPPAEAGAPGDAPLFTGLAKGLGEPAAQWIRENLHQGDLYLFVGYQQNEDQMAAAAHAQGARTIFLTSRPSGPEQAASPLHLAINPRWPFTDGCLELSGYDVKACPLSCILGMSCYFAMCAEALTRGNW